MLTIMEKTSDKELECDGSQDISVSLRARNALAIVMRSLPRTRRR